MANPKQTRFVVINGPQSLCDSSIAVWDSNQLDDASSCQHIIEASPQEPIPKFEDTTVQRVLVAPGLNSIKTKKQEHEQCKEILIHFEKIDNLDNPVSCQSKAEVYTYSCDQFTCGFCGEQFDHLTSFLFHKSKHDLAEKAFKCELCNKMMDTRATLKRHYCDHHKIAMIFTRSDDVSSVSTAQSMLETAHCSTDNLQQNIQLLEAVESVDSAPVLDRTPDCDAPGQSRLEHNSVSFESGLEPPHINSESINMILINTDGSTESVLQHIEKDLPHTSSENPVVTAEECPEQGDTVANRTPENHSSTEHISSLAAKPHKTTKRRLRVKDPPSENMRFLLIKETGLHGERPFTIYWLCCGLCPDYKTRHRNGFVSHMRSTHYQITDNFEIPDPHPIERQFDFEKVSIEKRVFTLEEYNEKRPVVGVTVKRRLETQDVVGKYPCPYCTKVFNRLRYLRRHKLSHENVQVLHRCEECGKQWKSVALLQSHIKKVHQKITTEFECTQCGFKSAVRKDIHKHRQIHPAGTVLCDVCGLAYKDNSTLKRHKDVHDLNRPFPCTYSGCNWRFKTEAICKAHIRGHTTVGKFKCRFCEKVFRHKHHVQRHEVSSHNAKVETPRAYNSSPLKSSSIEMHSEHLDFQLDDMGEQQILLVSGDLGPIQSLIGLRDEVILWPPGMQTD